MVDIYLFQVPADILDTVGSDIWLRTPGFPAQIPGLRVYDSGTVDLCLVNTAAAPTGMGGQVRIRKNGTTYTVYLVETTDPYASNVRFQTSAGTKAIRRFT
jgi:hypothetical protein